jgi:L-rhamnose mutarotase
MTGLAWDGRAVAGRPSRARRTGVAAGAVPEEVVVNRYGFTLRVRPEMVAEYRRRHAAVWPEMVDALRRTGWHNYSLFLAEDGTLFGYVETPASLDEARAAMAAQPVNARWQAEMAPFFEGDGLPADQMMGTLEEVFHLD